jgi:glycosyltransferase involved in cell wall biosynthesis
MILHDVQDFGGLEEYAATLAIGLKQTGHDVCVLCDTYIASDNQYLGRLRRHHVPLLQLPSSISRLASEWATKEKILTRFMLLLLPLPYLLAVGVAFVRHRSWRRSVSSAKNWLRRVLMTHVIGPDFRSIVMRPLLRLWRFWWRPDLLHIQGYTNNLLYVVVWAHVHKLPVVYEEHQTPDARFDWWRDFPKTINKAAVVVAVSEESGHALREVCGVTRPVVVRSPLLPDPMKAAPSVVLERQRRDRVQVTTVARLAVTKGLSYLLEAIAEIQATSPEVQFRVHGDGELRDELLAQADALGLDGHAIFPGPFVTREDLARIMAGTDIFVLSSILEGQPLALVEAMAYGCPIVATEVGGIPELISHGVNGLLCPPGDAGCLARQILALINDPQLRARLGSSARDSYVQGPFQPAAVCRRFVSVYDGVLRQQSVTASSAL